MRRTSQPAFMLCPAQRLYPGKWFLLASKGDAFLFASGVPRICDSSLCNGRAAGRGTCFLLRHRLEGVNLPSRISFLTFFVETCPWLVLHGLHFHEHASVAASPRPKPTRGQMRVRRGFASIRHLMGITPNMDTNPYVNEVHRRFPKALEMDRYNSMSCSGTQSSIWTGWPAIVSPGLFRVNPSTLWAVQGHEVPTGLQLA